MCGGTITVVVRYRTYMVLNNLMKGKPYVNLKKGPKETIFG